MQQSLLEIMNGDLKYISILERIKTGNVLLNKDILELEDYINENISYKIGLKDKKSVLGLLNFYYNTIE